MAGSLLPVLWSDAGHFIFRSQKEQGTGEKDGQSKLIPTTYLATPNFI